MLHQQPPLQLVRWIFSWSSVQDSASTRWSTTPVARRRLLCFSATPPSAPCSHRLPGSALHDNHLHSFLAPQERHSQPRPTAGINNGCHSVSMGCVSFRSCPAPGDVLLPANNRLAVSTTYGQKFNTIELHHSGKLQSRKRSKLSHQVS